MPDIFSELKRNCEILFSTLNLDIILSDRDQNILLHLLHTPFPEELMGNWGDYHTQMTRLIAASENGCAWHSMYDDLMLFLDLKILLEDAVYYVTLGPVLTKMISDAAFMDMLRQNILPRKMIHAIKNYIQKAPFFTFKTKNAFWIGAQLLLQKDLPPLVRIHPRAQDVHMDAMADTQPFSITNEQIQINYNAEKKWLAFVAAGDAPLCQESLSPDEQQ